MGTPTDVSPTNTPTIVPTITKTVLPTGAPTLLQETVQQPTAAPTVPITQSPSNICPEDITLIKQEGVTDIPNNDLNEVVRIVSQDTSAVTVKLNQAWTSSSGGKATSVDRIYYSFKENSFEEVCYEESDVPDNTFYSTITIQCMVSKPFALLEICVADDSNNEVLLFPEDNGTVPQCCHPTFPPETPVVCYTIEIMCETQCIEEEESNEGNRRGSLRGYSTRH